MQSDPGDWLWRLQSLMGLFMPHTLGPRPLPAGRRPVAYDGRARNRHHQHRPPRGYGHHRLRVISTVITNKREERPFGLSSLCRPWLLQLCPIFYHCYRYPRAACKGRNQDFRGRTRHGCPSLNGTHRTPARAHPHRRAYTPAAARPRHNTPPPQHAPAGPSLPGFDQHIVRPPPHADGEPPGIPSS